MQLNIQKKDVLTSVETIKKNNPEIWRKIITVLSNVENVSELEHNSQMMKLRSDINKLILQYIPEKKRESISQEFPYIITFFMEENGIPIRNPKFRINNLL